MKNHLTFFFLFFCFSLLAQNGTNVYISSRNTHSIKRYQADGTYLGDFVAPGAGGLAKPQDLFFHPTDSTLIVTGIDNSAILRFDPQTGDFLGHFSSGYPLASPTKMAIGTDDMLYVSQWGAAQNKVARFDLDGNFVDEFTSTGVPNGCGMAWDDEGNLYVASYGNGGNGNVHRFDPTGNFLGIFISSAILQGPVGLWQNEAGEWLVTDWTTGSVERFDAVGNHLGTFIDGLQNVEGHTFDAEGNIYLCDWSANEVNRYLPDGTFSATFIDTGGPVAPNSIIFGPAPADTTASATGTVKPDFHLDIFPNPLQDSFTLSCPHFEGKTVNLQLSTHNGQAVFRMEKKTASANIQAEAAGLAAGTYLCQVWVEDQLIFAAFLPKL